MPHPRIDMVFTYVDGAEPAYAARRAAYRAATGEVAPEPARWSRNVGEIAYAVRSALRSMPWIGTVFIVTDGQTPPVDAGLVESGRVRVVDHTEIIPGLYRPAYASTIIESFLHRIPGLSEVWLYANDDFLHGGRIGRETFLAEGSDGSLRLRLRTVPALLRVGVALASGHAPSFLPRANPYTAGVANAAWLMRRRLGLGWTGIVQPRHLTQVYRTATAETIEERFADELDAARRRHFRGLAQLSWSTLAYTAERHFMAAEIRHRPVVRNDELFVDFDLARTPGRSAAAWRRVVRSEARFICLNNIPESGAAAFAAAMEWRGLGRPLPEEAAP